MKATATAVTAFFYCWLRKFSNFSPFILFSVLPISFSIFAAAAGWQAGGRGSAALRPPAAKIENEDGGASGWASLPTSFWRPFRRPGRSRRIREAVGREGSPPGKN